MDCNNIKLQQGSTGADVKEAQTILKQLGYYQGVIDGDYGELTVDAVRKFQRSVCLLTDGWIGPVTCKKLKGNTNKTDNTTINDIKDITGHKFGIDTIKVAAETFKKHIKNNKNYPNYLTMKDSNGKSYNIGKSAYMGIFEDVSRFFIRNNRVPNYVVADGTANNPLVIDYQNNGHNCGPASLSMAAQMLATWITEPRLAELAGTTRNGTGPSQLIYAAKKISLSMTAINRNIESVKGAITAGCPVLMHIHTSYAGGRSCLGYSGAYGHYILCYGVKYAQKKYLLADPTKGFKTCNSNSIDSAKSSNNMKYYKIEPL